MKKIISILLCIVMMLPIISGFTSFAESSGISSLSFNIYDKEENSIDTIKWFFRDGNYYMFLPSETDLSGITVYFNSDKPVYVDGTEIVSGEKTEVFSQANKEYALTSGTHSYRLFVLCSANLPAVYLTTESGSLSYIHSNKENKEPGSIRIYENGKMVTDSALKQIKGRGNTTWGREKKPYNIKFDKKTSILGMAKAKKWSLLANDLDTALLRNNAILSIAESLPFSFTSDFRNVDLYINGEYKGNYFICESVEVGSSRLNITDLDDANEEANPGVDLELCARNSVNMNYPGARKWVEMANSPADITGGYLLEIDYESNYNPEISGFETLNGQNVTLKSPELASKAEVDYIASYYQEAEDALYSRDGYNSKGKHYSEYFDLESLAFMYILEEFSMDWDAGQTSCYIYKDSADDKFYVAPAWDFDMSLGNTNIGIKLGVNLSDPNVWFANQNYFNEGRILPTQAYADCFFTLAYQRHADFRSLVKEKWADYKKICSDEFIANLSAYGEKMNASAVMNAYRWNRYTTSPSYEQKSARYTADVNALTSFMSARVSALNKGFAPNSAFLCYDANGGVNKVLDERMYYIGDTTNVKNYNESSHPISKSGYSFSGWNTKPDGSGISYNAGDVITLDSECVTLFAQYNGGKCSCNCHKSGFMHFIWVIQRFFYSLFSTKRYCACGAAHY